MDKPKLSEHQYAVAQAAFATGHVLKNDKSLFLVGDDIKDAYETFDSFDDAKESATTKVQNNPEIDYVYDIQYIIDLSLENIYVVTNF